MSWVDILKETITQGRVKEIEDIDIDIEDDDCLRWYYRLKQIYDGFNFSKDNLIHISEGVFSAFPDLDEETACLVKEDLTRRYNINTETNNRLNRARETYRKQGFLTIAGAERFSRDMAYGVQIYTLVERLGDKRDTEMGEVAIDIYLSWRKKGDDNTKQISLMLVLTDERIKQYENSIKQLLRHLEQTWAIDMLTKYGAFK
tara:strand:- start:4044 stop:4649 length:606 start_codon:yes stop_codon:yes gene_type:complete